jgi:hypothetical protein
MDLAHAKAEFEAGRLTEAVAEPSEQGDGWRLVIHSKKTGPEVLTDHSGREQLYHSLDHTTEVGREIGFDSIRVEEHF